MSDRTFTERMKKRLLGRQVARISDSATIEMTNCHMMGNRRHGINVGGNAHVTINGGSAQDNGGSGLHVEGQADVTATDFTSRGNGSKTDEG